jgi:hypothetical protein
MRDRLHKNQKDQQFQAQNRFWRIANPCQSPRRVVKRRGIAETKKPTLQGRLDRKSKHSGQGPDVEISKPI